MNNRTADDAKRRVTNARQGSLVEPETEYLLALQTEVKDWLRQIDIDVAFVGKKPRYVHDCKGCVYCGPYVLDGHHYDLYYCANPTSPALASLIARGGSEGDDYSSGHPQEAFAEGYKSQPYEKLVIERARALGVYVEPPKKNPCGCSRNATIPCYHEEYPR